MLPAGQFRMWVVTSSAPTNPTPGDFECALDTLAAPGNRLIYAAGLGTNDIDFPSGVGVRVRSGQYVTLILHLVNVQGTTLSGTSGVTARTTSQLSTEADMLDPPPSHLLASRLRIAGIKRAEPLTPRPQSE